MLLSTNNARIKCIVVLALLLFARVTGHSQSTAGDLHVKQTRDFDVTGDGINKAWDAVDWVSLPVTEGEDPRQTKVKALYSETGVYFLFFNEDKILTASKTADFEKLWLEDVAEVFLWPDTTQTVYFEYEISPLNYELPLLVPNLNGKFLGWLPWEYSGERKTRHKTSIVGGEKKNGSALKVWYAEFFIPYKLMAPLSNMPPHAGTRWRANFYRVDYDDHKTIEWSWRKTETNFHQFAKFGTLIFD
jgi:hypothetical protein